MDLFDTRRRKEMLRVLTQRLKAQSLNEVSPFQPAAAANVDECDSGTESDEENAELQSLEINAIPVGCEKKGSSPPCTSPPAPTMSTSPLSSCSNAPRRPFQQLVSNLPCATERRSPRKFVQDSSDYERGSFDYEPRCSVEMERHSSEEELCQLTTESENFMWSPQVLVAHRDRVSSGSSDEEVRDLLSQPLITSFSSSPPNKGVHRLAPSSSSPAAQVIHLTNVSAAASPRKRHRQPSNSDDSDATVIQRPCLDFYKMKGSEQPLERSSLFRRHVSSHGISKAKLVKIKGLTTTTACSNNRSSPSSSQQLQQQQVQQQQQQQQQQKCLYDPSVFAFRSISTASTYCSPLTPVEEPGTYCAF